MENSLLMSGYTRISSLMHSEPLPCGRPSVSIKSRPDTWNLTLAAMTALQRLLPADISGRTHADWHEAVARSGGGQPREGQPNGYSGHRRLHDGSGGRLQLLVCRCGDTYPAAIFAFAFLMLPIWESRSGSGDRHQPICTCDMGGDSLSPPRHLRLMGSVGRKEH